MNDNAPLAVHTPLVHTANALHALPHLPQFALSELTLTQDALHWTWPAGHWHVPPNDVSGAGHDATHAPL